MKSLTSFAETRSRLQRALLLTCCGISFAVGASSRPTEVLEASIASALGLLCLALLLLGVIFRRFEEFAMHVLLIVVGTVCCTRVGYEVSRNIFEGTLPEQLPGIGIWIPLCFVLAFVFMRRATASIYVAGVSVGVAAPVVLYIIGSPNPQVRVHQMNLLHIYVIAVPAYALVVRMLAGLKTNFEDAERARKAAELAATRDPLTGVLNRRGFLRKANELVEQSADFSLIFIDVDHFKRVNDRFGHSAGDEALRHVVRVLSDMLRHTDLVGRWGGEEFVVLLEGCTTPSVASKVADKLRRSLAEAGTAEGLRLTASFGTAVFYSSLDETVDRADEALYVAKAEGRNCVATWCDSLRRAVLSSDLEPVTAAEPTLLASS